MKVRMLEKIRSNLVGNSSNDILFLSVSNSCISSLYYETHLES